MKGRGPFIGTFDTVQDISFIDYFILLCILHSIVEQHRIALQVEGLIRLVHSS